MQKTEPTPMMAQWHHCKEKAKEALLLFRLGDFYEAFYEDAKTVAKELQLTLTQRQGIPMCGVPFHSLDNHLNKLISLGYRVAIAEQMEESQEGKGLVKREVKHILSRGTTFSSDLLQEKSNNFFVAIFWVGKLYGIAAIDLSTAECLAFEVEGREALLQHLHRLRPSELLLSEKFMRHHPHFCKELSLQITFSVNSKEEDYFDVKTILNKLLSHFKVSSLDHFGLKGQQAAITALGSAIRYLKEELCFDLRTLSSIQTNSSHEQMILDPSTLYNLEIIKPQRLEEKGLTLLSFLDKTSTPMGGRLLQKWLLAPLLSAQKIEERQDAIEELVNHPGKLKELEASLSSIRDIERLITKISGGFSSPKDLLVLGTSLRSFPKVEESFKNFKSPLLTKKLPDLSLLANKLEKALVTTPPVRASEGGIFQQNYHPKLDELCTIGKDSKLWIANYQNFLKERTGIKTLKVGYTRVFGYYIEISRGSAEKAPLDFQRRQTLANAERFITEELKEFETKILTAEEEILKLEQHLYEELLQETVREINPILASAKRIAEIDALVSLASTAIEERYVRPKITENNSIHISEGRHPIVEKMVGHNHFIPNDTHLNEKEQLHLITGPNMAGKSTFIRQVALIVILAQIGSFVPAKEATIGIVDKIFSRIGASDNLAKGQSTFMVEMSETAHILHHATSNSLILLDEIGRGTSTFDGIAIAWAVAEYLLTHPKKQAKTLFATHYSELMNLADTMKGVRNYQVAISEKGGEICFLHKIIRGGTDKSYGLHVAKLAGVPLEALKIAERKLQELEQKPSKPTKKEMKLPLSEFPLFELPTTHPLIEEIKTLKINHLTPLEALQKLFDLQTKANK